MSGFFVMLKMNLKILLRNKAYICFLILLPVLAVLTLNIPNSSGYESNDDSSNEVCEMENMNEQIIKMYNTKLTIKVYDASSSDLSDYILDELCKFGSFKIYRYKADNLSEEKAKENASLTFNNNNIGAALYISNNLDSNILNNNKDNNLNIFEGADDDRISMLKDDLNIILKNMYTYSNLADGNQNKLKDLLEESKESIVKKEVIKVSNGDDINLNPEEKSCVTNIGWSLSIEALIFLFSGTFISSIIIKEKQNKVFSRSIISDMTIAGYGAVKLSLCIITVIVQMIFVGIGIKLFVKSDFGIPFTSYIFFVFCIAVIFNLLSATIGTITNNVLSSNYIAFFLWCMTNLLSGTYFTIDGASKWWQRISFLMPQRWVMKCSEMVIAGKGEPYMYMIIVTLSFIIVILSMMVIGIKVAKDE